MSKTKNVVIDHMNKQQTIQYLTDLMATVQAAYFKGSMEGRVGIDLYNFGGDGRDVVEGLHGVVPDHSAHGVEEKESGWVFCMCYDPDDEEPLFFLFEPEDDRADYSILPDTLPADLLGRIAAWLEQAMQPVPQEEEKLMVLCSYDEDDGDHGILLAVSRERFKNDPDAVRKAIAEHFEPDTDEDKAGLKDCIDDLMQEQSGYYGIEYYWQELPVLL